ncbi:MAG: glutamate racemase [Anaerococcus sp.]|nr:glutamate racemase [Anaerococcus sp.]
MTNIGVFDSGLGGLTVLRELYKHTKANYYYFGDTLRVPYGNRPKEEIEKFTYQIVDFLEDFDIDFYVIACNTISVSVLDKLEGKYKKKFFPITKAGLRASEDFKGDFLVLGTKATVESHFYKKNIEKKTHSRVYEVPAIKLVDLIENGQSQGDKIDQALKEYLSLANEKKIENIILACTHYPIIKESIKKNLTYKANIINPASYISDKLTSDLDESRIKIYLSKESRASKKLLAKLIDHPYTIDYVRIGDGD